MNALVDTSVWSLALRRRARDLSGAEAAVVAELRQLIQEGRAKIIGLVRQELLSGIKTTNRFEELRRTRQAFPDERIGTADYEAAAKASNECRAKGRHGFGVRHADLRGGSRARLVHLHGWIRISRTMRRFWK